MATYITTIKFTEKGIEAIHESAKRAAEFKAAAKRMGVKVSAIYWTLGYFDGVVIFDAPDEEAATAAILKLSSHGTVQTTTSRAFGLEEMERIVSLLAKK
jgi:uncharacterized protein with GYD domain